MATITTALDALATLVATIDPSPQTALQNAYVYPADYSSMDYTSLPWAVVAQQVNRRDQVGVPTQGQIWHTWSAEIVLMLSVGPLTKVSQGAVAEAKQVPYIKAMASVLKANQGLSGEAVAIGNGEILFDYQIGHIEWDTKVFWGIHFRVPVIQYF